MAKKQNYGFKTPQRRTTKNITGFKATGKYSGNQCKIVKSNVIIVDNLFEQNFEVPIKDAVMLFNIDTAMLAIGGYFHSSDSDFLITFEVYFEGVLFNQIIQKIEQNTFGKLGLNTAFDKDRLDNSQNQNINFKIIIKTETITTINYAQFAYGFVNYHTYIANDLSDRYEENAVLREPEQFYFSEHKLLLTSKEGMPIILKSCNRCDRFLPINHFNEKQQLSFNNHKKFTKYLVCENKLTENEINTFFGISNKLKYILETNKSGVSKHYVISVRGHQLECVACKKIYVNNDLNAKRTSSQRREDGLRRRTIEPLIRELLGIKSIYHSFKETNKDEFDKSIWEKFDKKCFNCEKAIDTLGKMQLDHTMPLVYLYQLDETATCLCKTCNGKKSDKFPSDFYNKSKIDSLSKKTGLDIKILNSKSSNEIIVGKIKEQIIWLIDDFLVRPQYQEIKDGKKTADLIIKSLQRAIDASENPFVLLEEYEKAKSV